MPTNHTARRYWMICPDFLGNPVEKHHMEVCFPTHISVSTVVATWLMPGLRTLVLPQVLSTEIHLVAEKEKDTTAGYLRLRSILPGYTKCFVLVPIMAFVQPVLPLRASKRCSSEVTCPRMGPWKPGEKDAAFQQQQEILARRRDKKRSERYFEEVQKRRDVIEERIAARRIDVRDGEDPLQQWKEMKEKGLIDEAGYSEIDESGIPIPMASFGIPKYDNGGRFDLKLPHVEHGYSDESADVMGNAGKAIKRFFGWGKDDQKGQATDEK